VDSKGKPVIRVQNQTQAVVYWDSGANGWAVDADKLRRVLAPYVHGPGGKREVLLDAKGLEWGMVVAIQDAARFAGVREVHYLVPSKAPAKPVPPK
jgi:hypothetical protein